MNYNVPVEVMRLQAERDEARTKLANARRYFAVNEDRVWDIIVEWDGEMPRPSVELVEVRRERDEAREQFRVAKTIATRVQEERDEARTWAAELTVSMRKALDLRYAAIRDRDLWRTRAGEAATICKRLEAERNAAKVRIAELLAEHLLKSLRR